MKKKAIMMLVAGSLLAMSAGTVNTMAANVDMEKYYIIKEENGEYIVESNVSEGDYTIAVTENKDAENVEITITENKMEDGEVIYTTEGMDEGEIIYSSDVTKEGEVVVYSVEDDENATTVRYVIEEEKISEEQIKEYEEAGIEYDDEEGNWIWNEQLVRILLDEDGSFYQNDSESAMENMIYLIVKRNEAGDIEAVKQMTVEDAMAHLIVLDNEEKEE